MHINITIAQLLLPDSVKDQCLKGEVFYFMLFDSSGHVSWSSVISHIQRYPPVKGFLVTFRILKMIVL